MKYLIIITGLFFCLSAGIFPDIKSNTTEEEKTESIIYHLFHGKNDFLIAYTEECYWWSDKKDYQIIACNDNVWKKITVSSKRKKDGSWTKPKVQNKTLQTGKANEFIQKLTTQSFWDLERELLNVTTHRNNDATETKYSISDAINYKFEILTRNDFRIIESYVPEYFFEKIPEQKDRGVFINCRNDFQTFIKQL